MIYFSFFIKKNRKSRVKRMIRVPAISSKIADIPVDEYSWRKYGQKPIKGSPYPRYVFYSYPPVILNPSKSNINLHAFQPWNRRTQILIF